jgi:hypothetical protein
VIIANDDIICTKWTVDAIVDVQNKTEALLTSAQNIRGIVESPMDVLTMKEQPAEEYASGPDFSFFYLTKKTWGKIGQFDENFFPAYFEDNDYHARIVLAGSTAIRCTSAPYYHYGSVTQNKPLQESEEKTGVVTGDEFDRCRDYFIEKWGCPPSNGEAVMLEKYYKTPFDDGVLTIKDCPKVRSRE